ncbi:response regulator transcription factor [Clostridium luticellarii]|jgi:DNA-binding response OmpR family regulator|uniref:Stage 0 sporulation protein A homolog n=1 Tax=Clostridium luticellarii TaxID=1691940 RepID=A0A2T0BF09_9CLOT|nr:response regulator transcription factor [Clostridium luticellarii]MCI1945693.1 response regulator transcription factor [Clostridium luticellarii]MCI1969052.1 response regulator transcription factor [Clostridium luticellarii]MCI1996064.1 response regulator transcription factor [Clostridium luticellarii]MCI2040449.1 response regulator transcription factor [Clostridium luticellarii]PRR82464.1 Transcriptional regulatory protein YycF [Clostridium luticellarii]
MYRLLLVEDDNALAAGIEFTLKDEGYEVLTVSTVKETKKIIDGRDFHLVILDINLPDGSGYDLCKYIRSKSDVPIVFLTALDEEVNIVLGLEIGGDDYITKPFGVRELLSRIKAIIRRNYKRESSGSRFQSGNITVDTYSAMVKKGDKKVMLTAQEYKLLLIFLSNPKVLLKRDAILNGLIEGEKSFFDENTLSVYIRRIREKIEDNPRKPQYIITQRGLGYKWNKKVSKE